MKWKILALLGLFTVSLTVVAQVLLTNLDQKSFVIDVTGPPTNVANLNLRRSQFSPSTTGWFITNVTGVTGISTNISTNDLWTIDGFGDLHPAVTNNQVTVTNLVVASNLVATGEFTLQKKSQLLVLGTNVLGSGVSSMFYLVSPTNDASQVIISLDDGASPGQLLLLVNYTNAVPANGAFTLPANSLVSGGGHVIQPEDWIATNTFAALYTWQSPDWLMIDAFAANGQSVFQTNYFQNIVVYSNITLRGNSTLTINNITISTNDLWHTNLVGGVATLQPINLGLQPMIVKGLTVGTNTTSSALLPAALANNVLSSVGNTDAGDPVERYIYIAQATSNGNPRSWLKSVVLTNSNSFQLGGNDGTSQVTFDILELGGNDFQFLVQTNSATIVNIHPTATDGNVAYTFGTDRFHTLGDIAEIQNGGTNWWSFGIKGGGTIPEFSMNAPANFFSSIRATNGINFNIDGASAYQWRMNGLGFEPEFDGSTIASTLHPINGGHFNNVIWGDGGAGVADTSGNGSPEGVAAAAVGSVWRNTNGAPGTTLYIKETGVGNTGWTAIGAGGGGGATLWMTNADGTITQAAGYTNVFIVGNEAQLTVGTVETNLPSAPFGDNLPAIGDNHHFFSITDLLDDSFTSAITAYAAASNPFSDLEGIDAVAYATGNSASNVGGTIGAYYDGGTNTAGFMCGIQGIATLLSGREPSGSGVVASDFHFINKSTNGILKGVAIWSEDSLTPNGGQITNNYGILLEDRTHGINNIAIQTGLGKVNFGDTTTAPEIVATKAFQQYQGSLTHAGTVTLDFDGTTTANPIALTGNVTFAFSNLATNRTYQLMIIGTSTNSTITWPAGVHGPAPAISLASKWLRCAMEVWGGSAATNVWISASSDP